MLFNSNITVPDNHLPEVKPPNIKEFIKYTDSIKFIWFGHSTILVNIKNNIILIDPVLLNCFRVKMYNEPFST